MSFYRSLQEDQKNFKQKRITGRQYNASNGSSASFGGSRRTGSFRLWNSFTRSVNDTAVVDLGYGVQRRSNLLYHNLNSLYKKYVGSRLSTVSYPTFQCIAFDRRAYGDYVSFPATGNVITSNVGAFQRKSYARSLSGNQLYNTNNYIPIVKDDGTPVGILFPWQGIYLNYNQIINMGGTTTVFWNPVSYKQQAYYFCRANNGGFNFSNNISFSAGSSTRTYITTMGLYGQSGTQGLQVGASPLLAVAKLSTPVKKNDEVQYIFKVNVEF